jgi:tetratricopeptide (TPR) repeat protein
VSLAGIAQSVHCLGRWEEAEQLYREALEGLMKYLDRNNLLVSIATSGLGLLLHQRGNDDEAIEHLTEALQGLGKAGTSHLETYLGTYLALGDVYIKSRKYKEAHEHLSRGQKIYDEKTLVPQAYYEVLAQRQKDLRLLMGEDAEKGAAAEKGVVMDQTKSDVETHGDPQQNKSLEKVSHRSRRWQKMFGIIKSERT